MRHDAVTGGNMARQASLACFVAGIRLALLGVLLALSSAYAFAQDSTPLPAQPGNLPNAQVTPGAVLPVTREQVCSENYVATVPPPSDRTMADAYAAYGVLGSPPGMFTLDHLVPVALGGSNDIKNLWPQPVSAEPWNARVKRTLAKQLYDLVCSGRLPLKEAQDAMAKNWISAYWRYVGE